MEGSAEDQDDFLVSVLNMIPPEMSSGAAPPPTYYDYEKEFSHRKMLGRGGNGLIRLAFSESRKQQVILKNLQDSQLSPVKAALLFDKEVNSLNVFAIIIKQEAFQGAACFETWNCSYRLFLSIKLGRLR